MNDFTLVVIVLWFMGWMAGLASFHRGMRRLGEKYPSKGVKMLIPVVLFFMWPYFLCLRTV